MKLKYSSAKKVNELMDRAQICSKNQNRTRGLSDIIN